MVDIVLAGSGGMMPLPDRWLSCLWVEYMGKALLIDCGEGTQIALKKAGCKLSRLDAILITHFHADHIAGLPGLLLSIGNCGKTTPLKIIGPRHITEVARSLLIIAPVLPFPVEYYEAREKTVYGDFIISSIPLRHSISCFGYGITIKRKPIFNPKKAENLGIPKPMYKVLHGGNEVTLSDGRTVTPDMVLDGERKSHRIVYVTDTKCFDKISDFAADSDIFVCEGMHGNDEMRDTLADKGHMVFSESAGLASKANAGRLILTHLSPALNNPYDFLDDAKKIFPNTEIGYDGLKLSL